jgi:release factor glutamine methyltransferase
VTVLEAIQRTSEFLTRKGVDSPRLQAELLLASVLKLPRMQLYLNFERPLAESELGTFREQVRRRAAREPLQQILGSTSFCGFEIAVSRHVLTPRPETEQLAEHAWQWVEARFGGKDGVHTECACLDYGTGSGCLAIAVAAKCARARFHALDISAEALELAQTNAVQNGVQDRITFIRSAGLEALPEDARFHLLVSNPPYIPTQEIPTLQPEVKDFEPLQALDGGADGLDFYRMFAAQGARVLHPGGKIMLEFGDGQADAIQSLFEKEKWIVDAIHRDYTQRPRILVGTCR